MTGEATAVALVRPRRHWAPTLPRAPPATPRASPLPSDPPPPHATPPPGPPARRRSSPTPSPPRPPTTPPPPPPSPPHTAPPPPDPIAAAAPPPHPPTPRTPRPPSAASSPLLSTPCRERCCAPPAPTGTLAGRGRAAASPVSPHLSATRPTPCPTSGIRL